MLDYVSGFLGYDGSLLPLDKLVLVHPDGRSEQPRELRKVVRGSYGESVVLGRAIPTSSMLYFAGKYNFECSPVCLYYSGNPVKWVQRHNVFGPPARSLAPVVQAAVRLLPGEYRPSNADSKRWFAFHRTRVDVTVMVDLGKDSYVHEWLHAAAKLTRSRQGQAELRTEKEHGHGMISGETVYWQRRSKLWTIKAYCKFCELAVPEKGHHPADLKLTADLRDCCQGMLRIELTLRTDVLKPLGTLDESLVWEYLENKIEVGVMKAGVNENNAVGLLPRNVAYTFEQWMNGCDVMHLLPRMTVYRHRLIIKDKLGLDIANKYEEKAAKRDVYDLAYLKAHEVKIVPASMQGSLFKAADSPVWGAH